MPQCVKCNEYILAHPDAVRERPELYKTKCELGGVHEFEQIQRRLVINAKFEVIPPPKG